jgi:thiol-disulfide isomerase/thioredoxin
MARTPSTQRLPLGSPAPEFKLPDADGKIWASREISGGQPMVVVFACNHCPYVIHVSNQLGQLSAEYLKKGVAFVAINSNDVTQYPDDSPEDACLRQGGGLEFSLFGGSEPGSRPRLACRLHPRFLSLGSVGKPRLRRAIRFHPSQE